LSDSSPHPGPARVLLAEESLPIRRVIREALTSFRHCEVDDCPTAERAFELALSRPYQLFILAVQLPDLSGITIDRLIAHAYPLTHKGSHTAPPVVFLARTEDGSALSAIQRNVRLRGTLTYPPKLDALLALTTSLLPDNPSLPHFPRVP
jgi:CheY-like chemotaxis protein